MKEPKENNSSDESCKAFVDHQSAIDNALNERIRDEQNTEIIDPERDSGGKRDRKTELSQKKTGGGKQSNPGD
jgi:hypothetical protein